MRALDKIYHAAMSPRLMRAKHAAPCYLTMAKNGLVILKFRHEHSRAVTAGKSGCCETRRELKNLMTHLALQARHHGRRRSARSCAARPSFLNRCKCPSTLPRAVDSDPVSNVSANNPVTRSTSLEQLDLEVIGHNRPLDPGSPIHPL